MACLWLLSGRSSGLPLASLWPASLAGISGLPDYLILYHAIILYCVL